MHRIFIVLLTGAIIVIGGAIAEAGEGFPLGFPYLSWAELSVGRIEGVKAEGAVEQGLDLMRFGDTNLVLNTFVGGRFTLSDQPLDVWNQKITALGGVKVKYNLSVGPGHWNTLAVGVRAEQVHYFNDLRDSTQVLGFISVGFGGDWLR